MPVFNNILAGAAGSAGGAAADFKIERSLRFSNDDTAYLSRTPSSEGNRKTWTWSAWVKRSKLGTEDGIFVCSDSNGNSEYVTLYFNTNNELKTTAYSGVSIDWRLTTNRVFRDPSAWMHIVLAVDTTQSTNSDRVKLFINGVKETSFRQEDYPDPDYEGRINKTEAHAIGSAVPYNVWYGDFYLAEIHFLDGLTPGTTTDDTSGSVTGTPSAEYLTDFGQFDADTGVWNPIQYTGSYNATGTGYFSSESGTAMGATRGYAALLDGSTSTSTAAAAGQTYTINFNTITNITSLRIWGKTVSNTGTFLVNGNDYLSSLPQHFGGGYTNGAWFTVPETTLSSIQIGTQSNGYEDAQLYKIEINGTDLIEVPSGVNGFHLDFSDNSSNAALGFDANVSGTRYSPHVTGFGSPGPANMFDGDITTSYAVSASNTRMTFTPSTAIPYLDASGGVEVKFMASAAGQQDRVRINGGSWVSQPAGGGWHKVSTGDGSITSMDFEDEGTSEAVVHAIRVNGTILTDPSGANDWTVNNLTAVAVSPNNTLSSHSHTGHAQNTPRNNFVDGDSSTPYHVVSTGTNTTTTAIYTFGTTLSGPAEVLFRNGNGQVTGSISIDGGSNYTTLSTTPNPTWISVGEINSNQVRLRSTFNFGGGSTASFYGFRVGGTEVITVDGAPNVDSLIDTPTNYDADSGNNGGNYAVLNALDKGTSTTVSQGALKFSGVSNAHRGVRSTIMPTSKMYAEMTVEAAQSGFGLANASANLDTHTLQSGKWAFYSGEITSQCTHELLTSV